VSPRRSLHDEEWAERVWQRYERRRDLPRRQLAAAWDAFLEEWYRLIEPALIRVERFLRRWGQP
jgi:hypothetical protein